MSNQNWKICFLRFKGPLHLSKGRNDTYDKSENLLHSDTLKSAMFAELKQYMGEEIDDSFLDAFKISSAFPFLDQESQPLLFMPRPAIRRLPLSIKGLLGSRLEKQLKKIKYLSLDLFTSLFVHQEKVVLEKENFSLDGKLAHSESIKGQKIFYGQTGQHVYIPNDKEIDSTTFYVDELRFASNAGLYFWIDIEKESTHLKHIKLALALLSDAGIGTDKNNGFGYFDFNPDRDIVNMENIVFASEGSHEMALSLYCPKKEEINELEESGYRFIKRGGYIASPKNNRHLKLRKKSIHMFEEGSFFPKQVVPRVGKLVDLKPDLRFVKEDTPSLDHPIWRDGRALFFPINLAQ